MSTVYREVRANMAFLIRTKFIRISRLTFGQNLRTNCSSIMEKDKNLKSLIYKRVQNGPKLRTFAQTQISKS